MLAYQYRYVFLRLNRSFVLILFRPAVPINKTASRPSSLEGARRSSISFSLISISSLSLNISAHLIVTLLLVYKTGPGPNHLEWRGVKKNGVACRCEDNKQVWPFLHILLLVRFLTIPICKTKPKYPEVRFVRRFSL